MRPSFAIVGCGRVGTALAKYLAEAGYILAGLASKSLSSAKRVADLTGSVNFTDTAWEVTRKADIVFITTPDGAIKEACDSIAVKKRFQLRFSRAPLQRSAHINHASHGKKLWGEHRLHAPSTKLCLNRIFS